MPRARPVLSPAKYRDLRLDALVRALLAEGLPDEALDALAALTWNLNNHCLGALPCLCGGCDFRGFEATAGGERFTRDFVLCARHCLHYWVPASLANSRDRERLRRSVRVSLSEQLNQMAREHRISAGQAPSHSELNQLLDELSTDEEIPF